ncbi:CLCA_X family protein [Ferrimonas balearica]|uniref:CLCA_X family protein n=1 Tax=Ferrimonas balearica TaxID=44012 RepID=UPI001C99FCCF|nr:CLCA_X family protein [Ferrimonas balearica]MBY5921536.1 hypothetical protein [Ferrimonas balearica]MBY5995124.1 hypothetical protein [Ferrimonas balearica]
MTARGGLHRDYYRRGPDYRCGEMMGFREVRDQFGFGGLVVGRWVTREESALAGNLVFDALADLAFLLNVPPATLGLRQSLNLAFGTGGQPGVQAHYAPGTRTLALAKNAGAGALAHEWWHAFDHYIRDHLFEPGKSVRFASDAWLAEVPVRQHPLNQRLEALLATVMLTPDGAEQHDYVRRSVALDRQVGRRYFSLPTEMMARAFEAWVQSRTEIKNAYLVSGTQQSEVARMGGYPEPDHLAAIDLAIRGYFEPLGQALSR